jgi:hypothetical protein
MTTAFSTALDAATPVAGMGAGVVVVLVLVSGVVTDAP